MYLFKLPRDLMSRIVAIRSRTGKPLAKQVREAVAEYCQKVEAEGKVGEDRE